MHHCLRATIGLLLALLAVSAAAADALPDSVLEALRQAGAGPEALAAVALPLQHAAPPWQHRAAVAGQPGSAMKLVTSIVALDVLGPNHRGFTELRSAATLAGGTLHGDLVLKGGADPDFGVPQLWALLLELRQAGVQHIAGDVLIDRLLFDPPRADVGRPPFDEAPEFPYNVIPDALNLAGALLPLALQSDAAALHAATVPPLPGIVLDAGAVAINPRRACRDWDDDWQPARVQPGPDGRTLIALQGAYPPNCTQRVALQLVDRLLLEEQLLKSVWQGLGGTWAGRAREMAAGATGATGATSATGAGADTRLLARRNSRPLGEVLRNMNKASDNPVTRLYYLQLGVPGSNTAARADARVRAWLAQHGIDDTGLVLDNGSGLSRSERITPLQLAAMLRLAWHGRHAPELLMSLPVAGTDGTLRNRLKESPATGWARLKSGTLNNATALAGYVNDAQGRPWAVAMFVNMPNAARGRAALDALVDHIARVGFTPARRVGPLDEGP